jgi:predicted nucleic acid-binding protein
MSRDFIDSNVLLYLFSQEDPARRAMANRVFNEAIQGGQASISFQVVQEVLNGIIRRASPVATPEDVRLQLHETLAPLWRINPSRVLYERAIAVHFRYRYAFYDSLIIAAALEAGCTRLLSEDLQSGQRIEGLTIVNPFA